MRKLAIVTSHPIQYNAPWFKLLAESNLVHLKVFYTWEQSRLSVKYDPGFGKEIKWDIPLLEGYEHVFVPNIAKDPGTHHFNGMINPSLNREIADWGPDAILVYGWSFRSHLKCLRYFHGKIPVLFRGDSTLLRERPGIKKWLRRLFLTWVYAHVDYALYVGTHNKNYFLKHGLREKQLIFAPHAIDNERFGEPAETLDKESASWRKELGYSPEDLVILFAAKLEPVKIPFFLLDLASAIKDDRIKFLLVGNGPLERELKAAASGDPRIKFLDFQNQKTMPLVYRIGDLYILPSKSETWGLAVNEAMACNRPVMVSENVGCAIDLVKEGINGFIFSAGDADRCATLLSPLANEKPLLAAMGRSSGELIRPYSFKHIVTAIEKLVMEL
jgi:glycosyltransferase involved in cell wall biosynthesis